MASRRGRLLGALTALAVCLGLSAAALVGSWSVDRDPPTPPRPPAAAPATTAAPMVVVPSTPLVRRRTATVVMGGDLLWHDTVWRSAAEDHARTGAGDAYDFDPMFAALRPVVARADVAICHEEVPFAAPGAPLRGYPVFAAPPQVAGWIGSMGWDVCTTASNHSLDGGLAGLARTARLLEAAGVRHVGTFRSAAERRRPVVVRTGSGVRVAVVAATYGLNGPALPPGHAWAISQVGDADDLLRQAHRARRAGADIVVAHLHGGTEYDALPDAAQLAVVRRLTASPDVDLVLGDHAHVVQPITRVRGTWVAYGLGNLVAQSPADRPAAYEGVTVRFTFAEGRGGRWRVARAAYLPTQWDRYAPGHPIRIAPATGSHLASVRAAVHALGHDAGLVEARLR